MSSDVNHELLNELKSAHVLNQRILKFTKPIGFGERPLRGLFIRDCYHRLVDLVIQTTNKETTKGVHAPSILIIGDPGMGKTMFSYFLMHKLISQDNVNIIYDCVENNHVYSYEVESGQVERSNERAEELLRSEASWYVVDGCEPRLALRDLRARAIMLCTFRKQNYHLYEKIFLVNR